MDFLKSCTTNVHVLENVAHLSCYAYRGKSGTSWNGDQWKSVRKAQLDLRRRNILCVRRWDAVYIFAADSQAMAEIFDPDMYDLRLVEKMTLQPATSDRTIGSCTTREHFLSAVEGAIAFKLAQQPGTKHVGPWTWIVSQDIECDSAAHTAVLIRLHANFSVTGNLYLASEMLNTTLIPRGCSQYGESDHVIMAPHGVLAQHISQDLSSRSNDDSCKEYIRSYLEIEGIEIPENAEWTVIKPGKDGEAPCIIWPTDLCLVLKTDTGHELVGENDDSDWRSWFGSDAESSFHNPLAMAEEWYQGAAQRNQTIREATSPGKKSGALNDPHPVTGGLSDSHEPDTHIMTSSPFAQRSSEQQLAISGIYPTPPDGLTQTTSNTQLATEHSSSSMQIDQIGSGMDLTLGEDVLQPHGRDSIGSAFQQDFTIQGDDLFGDAAEELDLGDNAVDDADFSFFDEPDDDRNDIDLDDTNMLEPLSMEGDSNSHIAPEHTSGEPPDEIEVKDEPTDHPQALDPLVEGKPNAVDQPTEDHAGSPPQAQIIAEASITLKPEKPLSPFGIRERLLPPPVPASVAQADLVQPWEQRRNSSFAPVKFREGFDLDSKYANSDFAVKGVNRHQTVPSPPNIGLPKRTKYRQPRTELQLPHEPEDDDSDSEDDSFESSSSSEKGAELPPKLPWESKKRKRHLELDPGTPFSGIHDQPFSDSDAHHEHVPCTPDHRLMDTLETCACPLQRLDKLHSFWNEFFGSNVTSSKDTADILPHAEDVFDLSKQDLIHIAQIVGEQAISTLSPLREASDSPTTHDVEIQETTTLIYTSIDRQLLSVLPDLEKCHLVDVALFREPPNRHPSTSKPQPGQPRPLQRSDSTVVGPDYFAIPPPYVKIQRGVDNWEMLPTCLSFWESLGLGPASGPKNITAFCIFPSNDSLQLLVEQFMVDLGAAYESCKLGSHLHARKPVNESKPGKYPQYERGMAPVELGPVLDLAGALKAYASTCINLGKALAHLNPSDNDRNIVVYLLHPFQGPRAAQLLCACFWMLFTSYRDSMAKLHRTHGCDVVLQLLPLHSIASPGTLVMHEAKDMAMLAREVYDRCPPSLSRPPTTASALPILVAPSVALAIPGPKKIAFQLCTDPPSDLLHEGSILHLAYSVSADRQWLAAAWVDNSGQHFATISYCLRGRSFAETAAEVWERTREILAARQVMWRVFIVTPEKMDDSVSRCWRALCAKPRQQPVCATLLAVQLEPALQLRPPIPVAENSNTATGPDSNLFTPASTPQGATFTNSPDVSSHINAPPTPAPSETAATMAENDPDAHLTDLTDEAWAVLLSPKLSNLVSSPGLAHGMLFKRGDDNGAESGLPSLGVSLRWTIQVKPNGTVEEGMVKHSEITLREVLRIYRNLAILTKARGLDHGRTTATPLHIASVLYSVTHLNGMLSTT